MNAGDCFEMGRQSYINGDFYHTVLWMSEAMERLKNESNQTTTAVSTAINNLKDSGITSTTKSDILEYLAFSTYKEGIVTN